MKTRIAAVFLLVSFTGLAAPPHLSGIYPHLAFFNDEGECGTGAVVPWAGRLWAITYAPHKPLGSSDKLYSITPELEMTIHPESIGGTPASRMIHKESGKLFIGPYAIDKAGKVRAIPYSEMFGRHTGLARHLTDPAGKIVSATMEEGVYEIDVKDLSVRELWCDEAGKGSRKADLPGYHGKGFYSGQGVYVYANNGEHGDKAKKFPETPSGVLAEWDGKADQWTIVRRNQFTEVTGPGGIEGNPNPATDPIWSIGWDAKSLIMATRSPDVGWTFQRLPKASHSYDGAHGWNTEWPRIRDIGEKDLLMTMHGTFWKFPRDFGVGKFSGIAPRSNYLKVIGDFCRWRDEIVFGCDDTAHSEFLNKRKAKGSIAAPRSQSNLWFVDPANLDRLGPVIGRGAVWLQEAVKAGKPSDPFLFSGYQRKALHLHNAGGKPVSITLEVDKHGDGNWSKIATVKMDGSYHWLDLGAWDGSWIRLTSDRDLPAATAWFHYANPDTRGFENDPVFAGFSHKPDDAFTGGLIRATGGGSGNLEMAAMSADGKPIGAYELDADLTLSPSHDSGLLDNIIKSAAIPTGVFRTGAGSILMVDDQGKRWRLPKGDPAMNQAGIQGTYRVAREVATERDLLHVHGTFYELPSENAGGFAKLRPVSTHNLPVHDFCSFRGLFVMSGAAAEGSAGNPHIIRSTDGKTALWAGAIDDIWKLGKPRGIGGPWERTEVKAGEPSDPYLMTGYDRKSLLMSTTIPATITAEIDISGTGHWAPYQTFKVEVETEHAFPESFQAYWIRFTSDRDTTATATLTYD